MHTAGIEDGCGCEFAPPSKWLALADRFYESYSQDPRIAREYAGKMVTDPHGCVSPLVLIKNQNHVLPRGRML
jgi:hypothetical protein